jgi:hypothetical protein
MDWVEKHQKECKILDSDKCMECFHISERHWALTEAHEERNKKKRGKK